MKMKAMAAAAAMMALGAGAAELTVMSTGAVKSPFTDASTQWSKDTGHRVTATFDPAGPLREKIASGVRGDIVIIPVDNFAALERDGVVVPGTRRDLGAVSIGAAVKTGAPVPDISTVEGLRTTLKNAKSITYMDPERGTSGKYFDATVLPKLGIRDEVRAKTKLGEGGYIAEKVASGEIEIAFHNITEIIPVKGVTIVGLLPAELQKPTVYSGAVMKDARNPKEAQALLDYLASPAGRKAFLDRGFTAP
ncbi:MAG: molybdate ABC transporter substrate-binding protein [Burkholderiales bacterium]|nr:molybdate ABC transporter substrate-binding protein [Burkholderiales bacterium]